mgnify:CR=1 FL=1|jgi:hypothetical protein|tara:strand:+ start:705 stop:1232 length:528 start_codon:yes stop_codon:yes gene_type:complete
MSRVMLCPDMLKFYQKVGGHKNYDCHSEELEKKIAETQTNVEYRDSLELSWFKYCVRASDKIEKDGELNARGNKRFYWHDILKEYPQFIQSYHTFLVATPDREKAREMVVEEIRGLTNKVGEMLTTAQKGEELLTKMTTFVNGLTWFEYKNQPNKSTELDKMLSFVARYNAESSK